MNCPGPSLRELRRLTGDRCAAIAGMASLEELSGVIWAIRHRFAAPLTEAEQTAFNRRRAELMRRQVRA